VAVPAAARAHTEAGAEAFARFFIDELNVAWTKPAAGKIAALSDPGCKACASLESTAGDLVAKGRHYVSNPLRVRTAASFEGAPKDRQFVRLILAQPGARVVDGSGVTVETDSKKEEGRTAVLLWQEGSWRIYELGA
jgi:hypothetical protein